MTASVYLFVCEKNHPKSEGNMKGIQFKFQEMLLMGETFFFTAISCKLAELRTAIDC